MIELIYLAEGKGIKFEKAPFKITDEMLELIGGINSDNFKEYRKRLFKGYFAIYDNFEKIQKLAEFMFIGQGKYFPCFIEKENALANLKERLRDCRIARLLFCIMEQDIILV